MFEGSSLAILGLAIKVLIGDAQTSFTHILGDIGIYADRLIGPLDRENMFLMMVFSALGTVFFRVSCQFCAMAATAHLQIKIFKNVWNRIFHQFMTMEFAHISSYRIGDLNRYINDSNGIGSWLQHLNKMIGTLLNLMIYTVMLLWLSFHMSIIAFILFGFISLAINVLIKKIRILAKKNASSRNRQRCSVD